MLGCHHSQNGFVLERMRDPAAFARDVLDVVDSLVPVREGRYQLDVVATITWDRPRAGQGPQRT